MSGSSAYRPCVLLVDDDPEIRLLARHVLDAAGCTVLEAGDADAARRSVAERVPDIILVDVMLGEEDGVALAGELGATTSGKSRIVFLTGATSSRQQERMAAAGAAGVLHKPFDPDAFIGSLRTLLGVAP